MKKFRILLLLSFFLVALNSIVCAEEKWVITYTSESDAGVSEYAIDVNNYRTIKDGYIYYEKVIVYDQDYTEQFIVIRKNVIRRATHTSIITDIETYLRDPSTGKMRNTSALIDRTPTKVNFEKGYPNILATIQFLDELEADK